jgi:hypothetical protein
MAATLHYIGCWDRRNMPRDRIELDITVLLLKVNIAPMVKKNLLEHWLGYGREHSPQLPVIGDITWQFVRDVQ